MNIRLFLTYSILLFLFTPSISFSSEIEWNLFLNQSGPILTSTGNEFTLNYADITGSAGSSERLLEALDGTTFSLDQSPVTDPLSIHIILNVQGNYFISEEGKNLCLNMIIKTYMNGTEVTSGGFHFTMIIPSQGLDYLMELCGCEMRREIIFVYYTGEEFEKDGIDTSPQVQGMVATMQNPYTIVGGKNSDLGFPASVNYSTWYKIKKLFE